MTVFILPTTGATKYRGKYPNRARSISGTARRGMGRHIELNDGTRLWSGDDKTPEYSCGALWDDYGAIRARAVPMTAEQYATLCEAAELSRPVVGVDWHGRRALIDEGVRAMVESIKPEPATAEPEAPAPDPIRLRQTRGPDGDSRLVTAEAAPVQTDGERLAAIRAALDSNASTYSRLAAIRAVLDAESGK